ncbi:hypothetical protein CC86DRAFT_369324 [Ophiobolus disseminans]|uniref:Uncharacterized protein n=1 Tax=Ophiobolus disseminans TaxID=1469910 RepID=A0A6A7A694_9PLEO|nr:hypothetical protein CC86DRAFT_369324 [Ophiobolus disseminans]
MKQMLWALDAQQRRQVLGLYKEAKELAVFVQELEIKIKTSELKEHQLRVDLESRSKSSVSAYVRSKLEDLRDGEMSLNRKLKQTTVETGELRKLLTQREEPLQKLAKQCASIVGLSFAITVLTRLPRELRDNIYDYLWDSKSVDHVEEWISASHEVGRKASSLHHWDPLAPSFADATYIGELFAQEVVTWFFRMIKKPEVDYRAVQAYLEMDTFGSMTFRPRDVIRRLTIKVDWEFSSQRGVAYGDLQKNLESVLSLPVRDDFVVEIFIALVLFPVVELFHVLEVIRPIYRGLVDKGMRVDVLGDRFFAAKWRDRADKKAAPKRTPREMAGLLNDYFDVTTPEEWLLLKETEINQFSHQRRKMKCLQMLDKMRNDMQTSDNSSEQ